MIGPARFPQRGTSRSAKLGSSRFPTLVLAAAALLLVSVRGQAQEVTPPQGAPAGQVSPRDATELRADILMARKLFAEAIVLYRQLLEQEPRNAALYNKIGIAYHQQMRLDEAKRHYERAVKHRKDYAEAINNIGTVHYVRKKYRQAIKSYLKAVAIRSDRSVFYSNLGYAYFAQKNYEQAMASFHRALELDPQIFESRSLSGSAVLDRSVGDRGFFYFFLAKSFAAQNNAERCAHYLRKARDEGYKGLAAVETDPTFAPVLRDPLIQEVLRANPPVASGVLP